MCARLSCPSCSRFLRRNRDGSEQQVFGAAHQPPSLPTVCCFTSALWPRRHIAGAGTLGKQQVSSTTSQQRRRFLLHIRKAGADGHHALQAHCGSSLPQDAVISVLRITAPWLPCARMPRPCGRAVQRPRHRIQMLPLAWRRWQYQARSFAKMGCRARRREMPLRALRRWRCRKNST